MPNDEKTRRAVQILGPAAAPPVESMEPTSGTATNKARSLVNVAFGDTPTAKMLKGSERLGIQVLTNVAKAPLWLFAKAARGSRALGPLAEATEEMLLSKERTKLTDKVYKDYLQGKAMDQITMDVYGSRAPRSVREGAIRAMALGEEMRGARARTDVLLDRAKYEQESRLPSYEQQGLTRESANLGISQQRANVTGTQARTSAVQGAEQRAQEGWGIEKRYLPQYYSLRNQAMRAGVNMTNQQNLALAQRIRQANIAGERVVSIITDKDGVPNVVIQQEPDPNTGASGRMRVEPLTGVETPSPLTGQRATIMEGTVPMDKVMGPNGEWINIGQAARETIDQVRTMLSAIGSDTNQISNATLSGAMQVVDAKYLANPEIQRSIKQDHGIDVNSSGGRSKFMKMIWDPETKVYNAGLMLQYVMKAGITNNYLSDVDRVAKQGMLGGQGLSSTLFEDTTRGGSVGRYFGDMGMQNNQGGTVQPPAIEQPQNMAVPMPKPTANAPGVIPDDIQEIVDKINSGQHITEQELAKYQQFLQSRK